MKDKTDDFERIHEYAIYRVADGFIIHNTNYPFNVAHTHIRNHGVCLKIIQNCILKRKPKTRDKYLLTSHIRICKDPKYQALIQRLIDKEPKQKYVR